MNLAAAAVLSLLPSPLAASDSVGALALRLLDRGAPAARLEVTLDGEDVLRGMTDDSGRVLFERLPVGSYRVSAGGATRTVVIDDGLVVLHFDTSVPSEAGASGFGQWAIDEETLTELPNAGTASSLLEMLDPYAITNRIDVGGVESDTEPLWSVRGSSWTQNRVTLDGLDITDPAGGAPLLYSDIGFYEAIFVATSALSSEAAGPGAEIRFVTKARPRSLGGSLRARTSGGPLQSSNIESEHLALGIEPRELTRYLAGSVELGSPRFYAAARGVTMDTRVPKFTPEVPFDVAGFTGKLTSERFSVLGTVQRLSRPRFGARPDASAETTVDASQTFQLLQASLDAGPLDLRLGFARGSTAATSGVGPNDTPLRDLATGAVSGAPRVVTQDERRRWSARGSLHRRLSSHLLRAGFELSRASENAHERVPGGLERLTVDGAAHAVSLFERGASRDVALTRVALFVQDAMVFHGLGRSWRLSPGLRLDDSRGGGIGWTSLSANVEGGLMLTPSSEVHFSAGLYPHALTTQLHRADEALTWKRRRWTDDDGDGDVSDEEIGAVLKRGGGEHTSIEPDPPRPVTLELTVGIDKRFRRGFIRFSGYQRWERNLLHTVNVGIDPASYHRFLFHDVGIDGVLGSEDDVDIPVYDRIAQHGEDRYLLTHPEGLGSLAQGVDLLLGFDHGRFSWRLSGRAYRDVGSGNPGNEARLNDTGVIGELFDDPNTLTNAKGRLFFDRAFTGKLALTAQAPLGLQVGAAARYWDGQPFARHLFFEELGQGFTLVQAFPRGRLRYAFNMTVDLRVERDVELGGTRLALAVDAFNLFNQSLHTAEVVRSGMRFRDPTFIQPARTLAVEARLRF